MMKTQCDNDSGHCKASGLLQDMGLLLAKRLNFTLEHVWQEDGDWGVQPKSGPYNMSGEWGGVMGGVIKGDYPWCLNAWTYMYERKDILDFVPFTKTRSILVLTPQNPAVDMELFLRPFTENSWKVILLTCVAFAFFISIPIIFGFGEAESTSLRIIKAAIWIFFVLISAYYGGALTMFFSTEVKLSFESLYDVLDAYPDWTLIRRLGEIYV